MEEKYEELVELMRTSWQLIHCRDAGVTWLTTKYNVKRLTGKFDILVQLGYGGLTVLVSTNDLLCVFNKLHSNGIQRPFTPVCRVTSLLRAENAPRKTGNGWCNKTPCDKHIH